MQNVSHVYSLQSCIISLVDYNDVRYYKPEDDRFNAIKHQGWTE